jgi:hypothetical protein
VDSLVAPFAKIGGAVFTGDTTGTSSGIRGRLISETGVKSGADNTNYSEYVGDSGAWIPKLMLDFLTGAAYFGAKKIMFNPDGSGHLANGNIEWDAAGNGEFTGKIQSGATGNRFIIDPAGPSFKMMDILDREAVSMYFSGSGSYYNGTIRINAYVTTVLNSYSLLSGDGLEVLHMNPNRYRGNYYGSRMRVYDSTYGSTFEVDVAVGSPPAQSNKLIIKMTNLPTSSAGLYSGMLYRDGEILKIV